MTVKRLRDVLSAIGPPATSMEIAELIWLAEHLPPAMSTGPEAEHAVIPASADATVPDLDPITDEKQPDSSERGSSAKHY